jgi:hypothetical protein
MLLAVDSGTGMLDFSTDFSGAFISDIISGFIWGFFSVLELQLLRIKRKVRVNGIKCL